MEHRKWQDYFFQGLLIVFSVLLALFLNQIVLNIETSSQKEKALSRISEELDRNLTVIENWLEVHEQTGERIGQLLSGNNDDLKQQLTDQPFFNFDLLTGGRNFIDSNLSSTAWETARSTDIVNEFEFETVEALSGVYALQNVIFEQTIRNIVDTFFDRQTHDMDNIDATLIQFNLRFSELIGQERLLIELYKKAIEDLE